MNNVISSKDNHNHTLVFTGKGGKYFVICLVNFLLTCITFGIYAPGDGENVDVIFILAGDAKTIVAFCLQSHGRRIIY